MTLLRHVRLLGLFLLASCACTSLAFGQTRLLHDEPGGPEGTNRLSVTKTSSPLSHAHAVALNIPLDRQQTLSLGVGYKTFNSFQDDPSLDAFGKSAWKLQAVPVSAEYVYTFAPPTRRLAPVVSAGVSLYLSRMRVLHTTASPALAETASIGAGFLPLESKPESASRLGVGFGAHAGLGVRYLVGRDLFVLAQGRYDFVDGLGLYHRDDRAEFSKIDFVIGVGYRF